jgi:hypothetical protein
MKMEDAMWAGGNKNLQLGRYGWQRKIILIALNFGMVLQLWD